MFFDEQGAFQLHSFDASIIKADLESLCTSNTDMFNDINLLVMRCDPNTFLTYRLDLDSKTVSEKTASFQLGFENQYEYHPFVRYLPDRLEFTAFDFDSKKKESTSVHFMYNGLEDNLIDTSPVKYPTPTQKHYQTLREYINFYELDGEFVLQTCMFNNFDICEYPVKEAIPAGVEMTDIGRIIENKKVA